MHTMSPSPSWPCRSRQGASARRGASQRPWNAGDSTRSADTLVPPPPAAREVGRGRGLQSLTSWNLGPRLWDRDSPLHLGCSLWTTGHINVVGHSSLTRNGSWQRNQGGAFSSPPTRGSARLTPTLHHRHRHARQAHRQAPRGLCYFPKVGPPRTLFLVRGLLCEPPQLGALTVVLGGLRVRSCSPFLWCGFAYGTSPPPKEKLGDSSDGHGVLTGSPLQCRILWPLSGPRLVASPPRPMPGKGTAVVGQRQVGGSLSQRSWGSLGWAHGSDAAEADLAQRAPPPVNPAWGPQDAKNHRSNAASQGHCPPDALEPLRVGEPGPLWQSHSHPHPSKTPAPAPTPVQCLPHCPPTLAPPPASSACLTGPRQASPSTCPTHKPLPSL